MLSLIEQLPNISLSANSIFLKLRSTDNSGTPYQAQPMKFGFVLQEAEMSVSTPITVQYTEPNGTISTLGFTCVASPATENQLPQYLTSGIGYTFETWCTMIAERIGKHSRIAPYFRVYSEVITTTSFRLVFRPRTFESNWALTFSSTGGIVTSTDAPIAPVASNIPQQYRIRYEVFFEKTYNGGDFLKVYSGFADADTEGYSTIDVSDTLHTYMRQNCMMLAPPQYYPTVSPYVVDNVRNFYVRFCEEYGVPSVTQAWSYSTVKKVLYGGIADNLFNYDSPINRIGGLNAFLSFQQNRKTVIPAVAEWLPWYNFTNQARTVRLQAVCYNADLTGSTTILGSDITVQPYSTVALPFLMKEFQTAAALVGVVGCKKVDVTVVDAASYAWSEVRTFYADTQNYTIAPRVWCYQNAFGCPETLILRGEGSRTKGNTSKSVVTTEKTARTFLQKVTEVDSEVSVSFTYRTGPITKGEMETVHEALSWNNCFEILTRGYIPLSINTQKLPTLNDDNAPVVAEIQAEPRIQPRLFASIGLDYTGGNYWNLDDVQRTDDGVWWQSVAVL